MTEELSRPPKLEIVYVFPSEEIIKSKLLTPSQMIPNRSCSKEDLDSLQEESAIIFKKFFNNEMGFLMR